MFRFRLQRILELRERKQRDAATALVSAQAEADLARIEQERIAAARTALAEASTPGLRATGHPAPSVGTLRNLHFLLARLDTELASAASATDAAEQTVAQREDELRTAFRERRTIDRLRERHQETWRANVSAADRQQMDEIALSRFTQQGAPHGTSEPGDTPASDSSSSTHGS